MERVKSQELCFRCLYSFDNSCVRKACKECSQDLGDTCKCLTIKQGEECPWFVDMEEIVDGTD